MLYPLVYFLFYVVEGLRKQTRDGGDIWSVKQNDDGEYKKINMMGKMIII